MDKKVLRNLLSLSKIMVHISPKLTQTYAKNILVVASVMILFLQGVKIAILENRSMTKNTIMTIFGGGKP
jgi:hypothetical protein